MVKNLPHILLGVVTQSLAEITVFGGKAAYRATPFSIHQQECDGFVVHEI